MEASESSRQISACKSDGYSSNSSYWQEEDVLHRATLENFKRSLLVMNNEEHTPSPDQGSVASRSSPSTSGGGEQAEYWEVDDVLDAKNLANIANWTTSEDELSDRMEGICDDSDKSLKLERNMVYKIRSDSDETANQTLLAVWDGTSFVPIVHCGKESESVEKLHQSPVRNGSLALNPGNACYKKIYKSSTPTPSTLSLLRQATASTLQRSVPPAASPSVNFGTKELAVLLKKKQSDASPNSRAGIQVLPNGRPNLIHRSDMDLESLAENEYKVCKNCGTLSKNPNFCESCGKQLTDKDKTFKRDSIEDKLFKTAPKETLISNKCAPMEKIKFYGKKLNQQWQAYSTVKKLRESSSGGGVVRRGRPPTAKRKTEPETVVISSDDEGHERREQGHRNHLFNASATCGSGTLNTNSAEQSLGALNNSSASCEDSDGTSSMFQNIMGQSPKALDKRDVFNGEDSLSVSYSKNAVLGTRRDRMEDQSGSIPVCRRKKMCVVKVQKSEEADCDLRVSLNPRSVRMGLVTGTPVQPVLVSQEGFFIKMECTGSSQSYDVHISPSEIENIAVHMNRSLPVLFINPSKSCGSKLREQMNLVEDQFLPGSSELTLKFITMLLESCGDVVEQENLMSLFLEFEKLKPHSSRFLQVLTYEEANSVFIHTSCQQNSSETATEERISPIKPDKPPETIFVYTIPEEKGGITVTTEDILGLKDGEFLNDVIIDFYLKYLLVEVISEVARKSTYVFSSFFYKRMVLKHGKAAGKDLKIKRFESVQKWTKNVDIFTKDFVIVPINEHSHWFLAIICFPGMVTAKPNGAAQEEEIQGTDSPQGNTQEEADEGPDGDQHLQNMGTLQAQPCILVFDSLAGPSKTHVVRILRDYLTLEWNAKHKTQRLFDRNTMKGGYPRVPQQNNSYDCGIYLMQFMESFFERPIQNYRIPIRELENWFPLDRVANKRKRIRELITQKAEKVKC